MCMYFDTDKKPKAEAAIRKLKQTKSVAEYTHQFKVHAHITGWEESTLISQYRQGLKSNVRLALLISRSEFQTVTDISNLALQIDNEINGSDVGTSLTSTNQTTDPNAMDLSAMNGRLSEAEKTQMMRAGQCFRCGVRGHLSRDCPEKKTVKPSNGKSKAVRIAELEAEYHELTGGTKTIVGGAEGSKNGAAQE
ncbi:hypothetical protein Pst134EA_019531 [Puccinia striiformis f. sp. tritici]|uniref:hypothetical protein n=1 Tax=Puccinia striiformis f. sp. tritici TaxID=168172 RepID=UPI002007C2E4|nr:hypothetical protein Pst134EA_019531 [Puccinia striiformis f. sp. tritici]KAH9459379.1 hypothetical protein Pst134EA_019531 [Puccinia striiformis f. sp. tritici]